MRVEFMVMRLEFNMMGVACQGSKGRIHGDLCIVLRNECIVCGYVEFKVTCVVFKFKVMM
ncbi:hypothetical protein Bpfe_015221, partial [Biomphalaria pfeifferi]